MKFGCEKYRPVEADSIRDAADVFAQRIARKLYGRRAYARTCNIGAHRMDMTVVEVDAFVRNSTVGRNVHFVVEALQ